MLVIITPAQFARNGIAPTLPNLQLKAHVTEQNN